MARGEIELSKLTKQFAEVTAVDGIDLHIPGGEFFSLLGPSGCGKTTTLRMIAGFEQPTSGEILLDGTDVAYTPPHQRNVNTVFQNYALFPHLNVYDNIAFGLKEAKRPKAEIRERVGKALELVQLLGYERRRSSELSGGQRQRVALARALVNRPRVLLLDEPLGALDLKLRKQLQVELKRVQAEVGITFVYVTHDQEEALTMSDRLAVFDQGRIVQVGAPSEVYEHPASEFVAGFVGVSNIVEKDGAHYTIRPEKIRLGSQGRRGTVADAVFVGMFTRYIVQLDDGTRLTVVRQNDESPVSKDSVVHLDWSPDDEFEIPHKKEEG